MKMTLQNFRRTADTNGAAANVVSAFNRFGESLANGINSVGAAYAAAKQSQIDNANTTRQLNIAQQNADSQSLLAKQNSAYDASRARLNNAQAAKLYDDIKTAAFEREILRNFGKESSASAAKPSPTPQPTANLSKPNLISINPFAPSEVVKHIKPSPTAAAVVAKSAPNTSGVSANFDINTGKYILK